MTERKGMGIVEHRELLGTYRTSVSVLIIRRMAQLANNLERLGHGNYGYLLRREPDEDDRSYLRRFMGCSDDRYVSWVFDDRVIKAEEMAYRIYWLLSEHDIPVSWLAQGTFNQRAVRRAFSYREMKYLALTYLGVVVSLERIGG